MITDQLGWLLFFSLPFIMRPFFQLVEALLDARAQAGAELVALEQTHHLVGDRELLEHQRQQEHPLVASGREEDVQRVSVERDLSIQRKP